MLGKPIALWSLGGLLLAQVSLSGGVKTTDFRPPDLSSSQLSGSTGSEDFLKAKALAEKGEFQKALPLLERVHKKSPTTFRRFSG
jgi:hypothetical protein